MQFSPKYVTTVDIKSWLSTASFFSSSPQFYSFLVTILLWYNWHMIQNF